MVSHCESKPLSPKDTPNQWRYSCSPGEPWSEPIQRLRFRMRAFGPDGHGSGVLQMRISKPLFEYEFRHFWLQRNPTDCEYISWIDPTMSEKWYVHIIGGISSDPTPGNEALVLDIMHPFECRVRSNLFRFAREGQPECGLMMRCRRRPLIPTPWPQTVPDSEFFVNMEYLGHADLNVSTMPVATDKKEGQ